MMGCKNRAVTGSWEQFEARGAIKTATWSRTYTNTGGMQGWLEAGEQWRHGLLRAERQESGGDKRKEGRNDRWKQRKLSVWEQRGGKRRHCMNPGRFSQGRWCVSSGEIDAVCWYLAFDQKSQDSQCHPPLTCSTWLLFWLSAKRHQPPTYSCASFTGWFQLITSLCVILSIFISCDKAASG